MKIPFELNGKSVSIEAPGDLRAVDLLRENFGLTGTKEGCGAGECGACAVLVDGRAKLSCLMTAAQLSGRKITTIEGLAKEGALHPVQTAFVKKGAVQCGFCTPGMVVTAVDYLSRHPAPTRKDAAEALSGNLCRCTGYTKILDAVTAVDTGDRVSFQPAAEEEIMEVASRSGGEERPVFLPETLEDLWRLLAEHPEAKIFSGGTDLFVWMRSKKINPAVLIGLARVDKLCGVSEQSGEVRIGAGTTHEALMEDPVIGRYFPLLIQALRTLGSPHIRRMGTLGGNIVTASPAGDTLPPLYVLGAAVEILSKQGTRRLPISEFILGPGKTALGAGEILSGVMIPKPEGDAFQYFEKVGLRNAMACAVASFAAMLKVEEDRIASVSLAWGSVGPKVMRFPEVEDALIGRPLSAGSLEEIMHMVRESVSPIDDVRASAEYRRIVAGNLLLRLSILFSTSGRKNDDGR